MAVKLKNDELKLVADEICLTVPSDAKMVDSKRSVEESDVFKEDYDLVKTVIEQMLEEIKTQNSKQNSQIELERLKLERVKAELKLAKLRNSASINESLTTKLRIVVDANTLGRRVLEEEMRLEESDEDKELPQGTEEVLPPKSERAHMLSAVPDTVVQPVTVLGKKGVYLETHLMNS
ncbi:uncharacterized protein TNCV_164911 [Trichonephila clavipes]|nr:uncharacterized protein TNCV_164911 [Trichonephila clavipes]